MTNYNNGKIYKIEALNGEDGDIYIGSTTKQYLSQRIAAHKYRYKTWKKLEETNKYMCFDIFDKYGVDNCIITLLETVNSNSKDELLSRESFHIRNLECVNKVIPNRTRIEYRIEYKDKRKELNQCYYQENKEIISENNKLKGLCECGSIYRYREKARHKKTEKHIKYLNSII